MSRIKYERGIAYDEDRKLYYLYMDLGCDEEGRRVRQYRTFHTLSAALHAVKRQELILRCPTEYVEPPRVVPKETHYYTSESLKRLYQLLEGHYLETAVHLAGSLGLRREEICGLRWDSVDFQLRKIHIRCARTAAAE